MVIGIILVSCWVRVSSLAVVAESPKADLNHDESFVNGGYFLITISIFQQ
jgi:hypothetical protein